MDRTRKAFATEVVATAKMMNALSPIHQMPKEVFAQIIQHSLSPIQNSPSCFYLALVTREYYTHLYRLRSVSSAWKSLVDSSPCLWTEISFVCHPKVLSKALKLSAQAPLNIILSNKTYGRSEAVLTSPEFLAQVGPTIGRWGSGNFSLSRSSGEIVQQYLTTAAPLLESVRISMEEGMEGHGAIDLFAGQADRLRALALHSFPARWDSQIFRRLGNLEIGGQDLNLKLSQLVAILSNNLELKELSIGALAVHVDDASPYEYPLSLPRLEMFTISQMPLRVTEFLLAQLDIPACRAISTRLDNDPLATPDAYSKAMLPFRNRLHAALVASSKSTIHFKTMQHGLNPDTLTWEIPGMNTPEAPGFSFHFVGWRVGSVWSWVEESLDGLEQQVHLGMNHRGTLEDIECLVESHMVDSIAVDDRALGYGHLLDILGACFLSEGTNQVRRLFPNLTSITVTYSRFINMGLKESLERRYKGSDRIVQRPPDLNLDFCDVARQPHYEGARMFVGMDGVKEVAIRGVPFVD